MPDRAAHYPDYRKALAAALATVLLGCTAAASEMRQTAVVKAIKRVAPAVVNIRGEKTLAANVAQPAGIEGTKRVNGMGSGVVIDPRGYILTNFHVVDGVREIQVTMHDKQQYVATLVARDLETDLALIKVSLPQPAAVIPLGTSSDLMTGESVIAVGNAFGYADTVTRGIVSAQHRAVQINDAQFYDDLIQTDAPINPGNSGGPLVNIDGEMIGINVAVRAGATGIGFAIPVDKAIAVAAALLGSAAANRPWHGVQPAANAPASLSGMKVAAVDKKSPAAQGGVLPGDVITAVDGAAVQRALDFQRALVERKAGERVVLSVDRGGKAVTVPIELAEVPETARPAATPAWELLGLELRPLGGAEFKQKYQTRYRGGLMVLEVRPRSPASDQGIHPGDVLVGMHIWETISLDNVAYILKRPDFSSINPVKFYILRGNETLYGYMPVSMKTPRQEQGQVATGLSGPSSK
jgi:serine protease Do